MLVTGSTREQKLASLKDYVRQRTLETTGLDTDVTIADMPHWAAAYVCGTRAIYTFSTEALDMDEAFLTKLAIHELGHIVDAWLFDGFRTKNGRCVHHDKMWKRICRILGDPEALTRM